MLVYTNLNCKMTMCGVYDNEIAKVNKKLCFYVFLQYIKI